MSKHISDEMKNELRKRRSKKFAKQVLTAYEQIYEMMEEPIMYFCIEEGWYRFGDLATGELTEQTFVKDKKYITKTKVYEEFKKLGFEIAEIDELQTA